MEPQPEPAADETFRYKVIKSRGATLYNDKDSSKFKPYMFDVTLPFDTIFTGSQPDTSDTGWVQITEAPKAEYTGKYLRSREAEGERVITPLINFDISNLERRARQLLVDVVMAERFEKITMRVEEYKKEAKAALAASKAAAAKNDAARAATEMEKAKGRLRLKQNLLKMNPMPPALQSLLSVKRQIIELGDEWLRNNEAHLGRIDCDVTEIRDCLEKCKLSAEDLPQYVIDFLDIYLSLKVPRTTTGGGKRKRKYERKKTQKRKKKSKSRKTHKRKYKKKRRNKTKRR